MVGWKGKNSIRAYVPKNERIHYLRLMGADTSKWEKNKFEVRREVEKKEEEAAKAEEAAAKSSEAQAPQELKPVMSKKSFGKYGDLGQQGEDEASNGSKDVQEQDSEAKEAPLTIAQVSKKNFGKYGAVEEKKGEEVAKE